MRESIVFRESRVAVQSSIHGLKLERVHQEPGNLATMQMLSQWVWGGPESASLASS